ncbi:hypothetical protein BC332_19135 [Capsicum chinense]|nr:hypothetical protein BC332_19135 [Capsicum chinense]
MDSPCGNCMLKKCKDTVLKYGMLSSRVLQWSDGYYNGDIKTRKTVQTEKITEDHLGWQRTELLRELYSSPLTGESEEELQPQAKRPSVALCPEDLIDIDAGKSWINTTCLLYGVSILTSLVAILSEMQGSERASDKLLMLYYPFLGFAVLSILRGLLPHSGKTISIGKRSAIGRKKRA